MYIDFFETTPWETAFLNDLFYFFWGISGFQSCDSYLRAKRCIFVAEPHCEATLIGNYPGSTAKPNSDW